MPPSPSGARGRTWSSLIRCVKSITKVIQLGLQHKTTTLSEFNFRGGIRGVQSDSRSSQCHPRRPSGSTSGSPCLCVTARVWASHSGFLKQSDLQFGQAVTNLYTGLNVSSCVLSGCGPGFTWENFRGCRCTKRKGQMYKKQQNTTLLKQSSHLLLKQRSCLRCSNNLEHMMQTTTTLTTIIKTNNSGTSLVMGLVQLSCQNEQADIGVSRVLKSRSNTGQKTKVKCNWVEFEEIQTN